MPSENNPIHPDVLPFIGHPPLWACSEVFSQGQLAAAWEENRVAGILTRMDLID
jgi:hypothetical protein